MLSKKCIIVTCSENGLMVIPGPSPQPLCDSAKKRTDAQMNRHCLCYLFQNYLLVLHQVEVVGYDGGVGQLMRGQELPV